MRALAAAIKRITVRSVEPQRLVGQDVGDPPEVVYLIFGRRLWIALAAAVIPGDVAARAVARENRVVDDAADVVDARNGVCACATIDRNLVAVHVAEGAVRRRDILRAPANVEIAQVVRRAVRAHEIHVLHVERLGAVAERQKWVLSVVSDAQHDRAIRVVPSDVDRARARRQRRDAHVEISLDRQIEPDALPTSNRSSQSIPQRPRPAVSSGRDREDGFLDQWIIGIDAGFRAGVRERRPDGVSAVGISAVPARIGDEILQRRNISGVGSQVRHHVRFKPNLRVVALDRVRVRVIHPRQDVTVG